MLALIKGRPVRRRDRRRAVHLAVDGESHARHILAELDLRDRARAIVLADAAPR
ncbi:hypothetical protein [Blastococcus capsensis]|uniref:hypothetical protein n=1 Tax=Blastococcus capsensis TaxID=1564163 RepID=UPI00254260D1|nr:hypothetical protein [Blastococcus capsensis]MDK3257789.1 hypothetical protein [Blastococcus capsensis]